jgi:CO/xanthine dehydrogenase Mo-binding subunit
VRPSAPDRTETPRPELSERNSIADAPAPAAVNADVPEIDVVIIDEHDDHLNPLGVKGLGELATTGVAAAVANAVYHATGVRVRDLPITLDKVMSV